MTKKLDLGVNEIIKRTAQLEKSQDSLIPLSREIIRNCANSIKCVHAGEMKEAREFLKKAQTGLKSAQKEQRLPHLFSQSEQEVCEAAILLSIMEKKPIPKPEDLQISDSSYLTGLCDCVGELRRQMLEELKKGRKKEAESYFEIMDAIHEELTAIRFSDSLLRGFRQKQDVVRGQVERARSELVLSAGR